MGEHGGEFPCPTEPWPQETRDLLDQAVGSQKGIVPLCCRGGRGRADACEDKEGGKKGDTIMRERRGRDGGR